MVFLGDFRPLLKQRPATRHIAIALLVLFVVVGPGHGRAREANLPEATGSDATAARPGVPFLDFGGDAARLPAGEARVAQVARVSSRGIQVSQATTSPAQPSATSPAPVTPPAPATPSSEPAYKRHPSPPGASVYFEYPTNGSVVPQTVKIRFGLIGMGVAPAGFDKAYTGHHHLIIDAPLPPLDQPVPNDFNHLHFALGQTEAVVTLPLGKHTLQLLFADSNHVPHNPPIFSKPIEVLVTTNGKKPHHSKKHKKS